MTGHGWRMIGSLAAMAGASCVWTMPAEAHPHIFAEARLEMVVNDDGRVSEFRHVWRFDEFFSSTVLVEFDANRNLELEQSELEAVGAVIKESLAEFDYFTTVTHDGAAVAVSAPQQIYADFQDGQLLTFFSVAPVTQPPVSGKVSVGVYDPTMYTAIDFVNDTDLVVIGETGACQRAVVRPDPDQIIAENQASLTDAFFNDPGGYDVSQLFATRLELTC
jgi:ABC-type uncharacterized transport system substrate-binding protein